MVWSVDIPTKDMEMLVFIEWDGNILKNKNNIQEIAIHI